MVYAVGSAQPSDVTRRQVEDDLKPLLEQIDGVAAVEVNGGEVREIQINLDPRRLEALNLPLSHVAAKLAADNLDVPGGQVKRDGRAISLRTKGEFHAASEIENVILRSEGGSTVRLRDVATVVDGYEDKTSTTRLDGVDAVSFSVRKQSGANTVEIAERVAATLTRLAPTFPSLQIRSVHNDADFITENVKDVRNHIIFGGLMAVVIIFVFMRDWRSTLISALALPTSVIATFFFMWAVGFTINMMTLMALSLVIGILIDDAVVVRENIYRHMEHGEDPVTAARNGTSEIGLAVMATTFTILAVFLPVGFMTGIVGQFFKSFALTIAFAVSMSLLVAFTLDPMLSSRFVRYIPREERVRTRMGRILEAWGTFYDRIDRRYHRVLGWAIGNPWKVMGVAALIFFASLGTLGVIGTEFVPQEDRGEFEVITELPAGTSFEESVQLVSAIERQVKGIPEVRQIFSTVGVNGDALKANLKVKAGPKHERARGLQALKADAATPRRGRAAHQVDRGRSRVHARRAHRGTVERVPARRRYRRTAALERRDRGKSPAGARRGRCRQHARRRTAGNGGEGQPRDGGGPWLRRLERRPPAPQHDRRGGADAAARRRQGIRHPGAARTGVPQRFSGHRPRAALRTGRRPGADLGHRLDGTRDRTNQHRARAETSSGEDRRRAHRSAARRRHGGRAER